MSRRSPAYALREFGASISGLGILEIKDAVAAEACSCPPVQTNHLVICSHVHR